MSEITNIEWAMHTGGPYLGCSKVSPGCINCYAEDLLLTRLERIMRSSYQKAGFEDWQTRPVWGDKATRVLTKGFWTDALRINAQHAKSGTRGRWFPSMIDWLDKMPAGIIDQDGNKLDPIKVLAAFIKLIHDTPNLDWLLLTKRIENWNERAYAAMDNMDADTSWWLQGWAEGKPPANVWIGVSVEDRVRKIRIDKLREIPAVIRFLSLEPLLEDLGELDLAGISWVIVGGESGPGARPCSIDWIRSIVSQCRRASVACFVKQLGRCPTSGSPVEQNRIDLKHNKGGDPSEWSRDLRVREFPEFSASESLIK